VTQGSVVRAQVTRRLRQAGGMTVVVAAPEPAAAQPGAPPTPRRTTPSPTSGEEAYQDRYGGSVIAGHGRHVLRTTVSLRAGTPDEVRDRVTVAVARAVLAAIPQGVGSP
jgi:hypothetical protein